VLFRSVIILNGFASAVALRDFGHLAAGKSSLRVVNRFTVLHAGAALMVLVDQKNATASITS
jgi:hypothetical protein